MGGEEEWVLEGRKQKRRKAKTNHKERGSELLPTAMHVAGKLQINPITGTKQLVTVVAVAVRLAAVSVSVFAQQSIFHDITRLIRR